MPQSIKSLSIVIAVILLWAGASTFLGQVTNSVQQCISLGVVLCSWVLLIVSRDEFTWRLLTGQISGEENERRKSGEQSLFRVGLLFGFLFGVPITIFLMALITWMTRLYYY